MPTSVRVFLEENGPTIRREGLRGNLINHMASLLEFGLLAPEQMRDLLVFFDAGDYSPDPK